MPTLLRAGAWLACVAVYASSATAQELTDTELVELIVRDGVQARAIQLAVDVVRREQAARAVLPNPVVGYSREGAGFTEFLQGEQFLPIFGSRGAVLRAGAAATAAAEAERDARLWQLRGEAQTLVARLLAEQEKLDSATVAVREVERIVALLRIREQEGEGSRFDRMRAEQELAEARQMSLDAAASAAESRAAIAALLSGRRRLTRLVGILYVDRTIPVVEELTVHATATRGELRALQASAERFRLEADAARRARLPAPTINGGLKRAESGTRRERGGVLGVNITLPFFDSGRRDASRWLAERDRIEAERAVAMQAIGAQIIAAAEILALRQDAVRALDASSPADELARIAELSYTEGESGILELIDAHRTVARARIRAIDLRLAARLAQIALERAAGDTIWP